METQFCQMVKKCTYATTKEDLDLEKDLYCFYKSENQKDADCE